MAKFVPFIIKTDGSQNISVKIVHMKKSDVVQTEKEPVWQTSWLSDYIQEDAFEKYALKTSNGELVALAAYEILENDVMVHITYIESQPESNPTIVGHSKKYQGIGRVLIAYGIKLSIDHECGGTVTFEAKVPELAEHYVRDYGACPLPSFNVTWSTATPEVRAFIEEVTRVTYEQEKAKRNGVSLSTVKPFFGDTAC